MNVSRLNALALGVVLVTYGLCWLALPSGEIAVHFGADGQADGFGTRTEVVGVMLLVSVATWLLLAWFSGAADRLHWSMVNIPRKDHWSRPENEATARARLAEDMALVNLWTMVLLAALGPFFVVGARRGEMGGLLGWLTGAVIVGYCVVLGVLIWTRQRFYRDVPEA